MAKEWQSDKPSFEGTLAQADQFKEVIRNNIANFDASFHELNDALNSVDDMNIDDIAISAKAGAIASMCMLCIGAMLAEEEGSR